MLEIGARFMVATDLYGTDYILLRNNSCNDGCQLPIRLTELVICFIERTVIAIPIAAVFMHLMF